MYLQRLHETYGEQCQDFAARERHTGVDGNGRRGDGAVHGD